MNVRPKRPLTSYMMFLTSAREQIKRENPGIRVAEVAKKGGELWRSLQDKSEWKAKADKAKSEYESALKAFEANGGRIDKVDRKRRAKVGKKSVRRI